MTSIKAFAELGRLAQSFAEGESITDEKTLSLIRSVYEKRLRGKISGIGNVTLDDTGNFKGEFQQYVNPRFFRIYSWSHIHAQNSTSGS